MIMAFPGIQIILPATRYSEVVRCRPIGLYNKWLRWNLISIQPMSDKGTIYALQLKQDNQSESLTGLRRCPIGYRSDLFFNRGLIEYLTPP